MAVVRPLPVTEALQYVHVALFNRRDPCVELWNQWHRIQRLTQTEVENVGAYGQTLVAVMLRTKEIEERIDAACDHGESAIIRADGVDIFGLQCVSRWPAGPVNGIPMTVVMMQSAEPDGLLYVADPNYREPVPRRPRRKVAPREPLPKRAFSLKGEL